MNSYLIAAGGLAFIVGLIHSILGEVLIFRRMRTGSIVPTSGSPVLRERHVRILWASWHIVTIFGWGFSAILFWYAFFSPHNADQEFIEKVILYSVFIASLFVLVGTKGRHPGWLGLLGIGIFLWLS